jgi:autoinducer 2-degrading protein
MYIVAVQFELAPEHSADFRDAVLQNAAASEQTEPGCHQFDVGFNADGTQCFLYEVYDDEAAFGAHRASAHFQTFFAVTQPMVVNKRLEIYERTDNPYKQ